MPLLGRDITVSGAFPPGFLLLETFRGSETLGRSFVYNLGLLSKAPVISAEDVIGQPLCVAIKLDNGSQRFFHGVVMDFRKAGATRLHTRYVAIVKP